MKQDKFKVYCEFELNGELHKSMESSASWFLLTQTGKLWTYDPGETPRPLGKEYKKAIPLFYTGIKDKNGKEIYKGDIVRMRGLIAGHFEPMVGYIYYEPPSFVVIAIEPPDVKGKGRLLDERNPNEVIGNIYENPELLDESHNNVNRR